MAKKSKKKNEAQVMGVVSIALGVGILVSLFLSMITLTILNNVTGFNGFDIFDAQNLTDNFWLTMTQVFVGASLVAVVGLLAYGVLLLVKPGKLTAHYKILTIVGSAVALVTAACASIYVFSTDSSILHEFGIGVGTVILAIVGIVGIGQAFVLSKK